MQATLFTTDWWLAVLANWNTLPGRGCLGKLGTVCFAVQGTESDSHVNIHFDAAGAGKLVSDDVAASYVITATQPDWLAFIAGEFSASQGALNGRLRISGSLLGLLPYSIAFNTFARASAGVLTDTIAPGVVG